MQLDIHVPICRSTIDVFRRVIDFFSFLALYRGMICINLYYPYFENSWRMANGGISGELDGLYKKKKRSCSNYGGKRGWQYNGV